MAEAIKKVHGITAQMIEGGGGIFDVKINGDLIYSKKQSGDFPGHSLINDKIAAISKSG